MEKMQDWTGRSGANRADSLRSSAAWDQQKDSEGAAASTDFASSRLEAWVEASDH